MTFPCLNFRPHARWLAALVLIAAAAFVHAAETPNIVFVLADDIGYGDVGPYKTDTSPIPTPNIDRLAAEGMIFTDALAPASVCAPTRYSALTGNYPFRGRQRWGVYDFNKESQLRPGQQTIADAMRSAGYATAFVGKMHLGGDYYRIGTDDPYRSNDPTQIDFSRRFGNGPLDQGFDHSLVLTNGIQASIYGYFVDDLYAPLNPAEPDIVYVPAGPKGGGSQLKDGYGDPNWDSSLVGPRLAADAVTFISDHHQLHGTSKPFFLYYASQSLHRPYTPSPDLNGTPVAGTTGVNDKADMIYEFDLQVGAIMAEVERLGLTEDTLIIVTSDNGGTDDPVHLAAGHDPVGGLRGFKAGVYEGGMRVPFIARWGDGTVAGSRIEPGSSSAHLVGVHDWVAAMYALTGQTIAEDQVLDSVNILPILLGQQPPGDPLRTEMVFQAANWGIQNKYRGIRVDGWTLILDEADNAIELYDLGTDPLQQTNLISDPLQTARVASMLGRYDWAVNQSARTVPVNDDPPPPALPTITIANEVGNENAAFMTFTVSLSELASAPVSVNYTTRDQSARAGEDYLFTSGSVFFAAGESAQTLSVTVLDDTESEGNEVFEVLLTEPINAEIATGVATGSITDDEAAACGRPAYEGRGQSVAALWKDCTEQTWHVRFVAKPGSPVRFNGNVESSLGFDQVSAYNLESNDVLDNDSDPSLISYMLRMVDPWEDGFSFSVPPGASICFDVDAPGDAVTLVGGGSISVPTPFDLDTLGACEAAPPSLAVADTEVSESAAMATVTVSLSPASTDYVTVDYQTQDDTALAGVDYQFTSGTLLFNAGETSASFDVPLLDDDTPEPVDQLFVELSNSLGAPIKVGSAAVSIADDDTSACGRPVYDAATEKALLVWQDCTTGLWTVRAAAGGSFTRYEGSVTAPGGLSDTSTFSVENNDLVDFSSPNKIRFRLAVTGRWEDGFSFSVDSSQETCLSLGAPQGASIIVGEARTAVSQAFDLRTLGPCAP